MVLLQTTSVKEKVVYIISVIKTVSLISHKTFKHCTCTKV